MKNSNVSALILFGVLSVGCVTTREAVKKTIKSSETFSKDYEATWSSIVAYSTKNGMNIKTIDKSSGVIAYERSLDPAFTERYLDCGGFTAGDTLFSNTDANVTLNFYFKKSGDKQTTVDVNLFGKAVDTTRGLYGTSHTKVYQCYSTGAFEKEMFCEIEGHPCPAPVANPTPKKGAVQY